MSLLTLSVVTFSVCDCICPTDDDTENTADTEAKNPTTLDVFYNQNGEIIKPDIFRALVI